MKVLLEIPDTEIIEFLELNKNRPFEILEDSFDIIPEFHKKIVAERLTDGEEPIEWESVKIDLDKKWNFQ